ncbi:alpha-hydroxy acid oxidase [Thalassospira lucentensis]|jgi:L-lactate dehydrogenase (cytochrome)|uniref:alpha-hydroxy acid oxidase n=1 Tax=Thalassospira lucentensis TaxID=168935 RepID=UPI003AA891D0|tara:strand:+ start:6573 stop:7742 length:1170 start_codon:yes stop_codon:yes gene_type:complete
MARLLNAEDFRGAARKRLPKGLFEYIDRGTEAELAMADIRHSLDRIKFRQSVLSGHSQCDMTTELFGHHYPAPLIVAPTALAGLVSYDGEVKLARAASRLGIPFCVSTQSVTSIDDIRKGAPDAELWLQLYVWKNRELTWQLLDRARDAGVSTLVITADTPLSPKRDYNQHNGFSVPFVPSVRGLVDVLSRPGWLGSVMMRYLMTTGMPSYAHYPAEFKTAITRDAVAQDVQIESGLGWDDIAQIRDRWSGKIIIKGILSEKDAVQSVKAGADGIVVSAHGGRNFDVAPAPANVLPGIAAAVGEKIAIMADSGVRRGSDVLKYLALGSRSVLVGRLPLYGLAAAGEDGAFDALSMLMDEMHSNLIFAGAKNLEDFKKNAIASPGHPQRE